MGFKEIKSKVIVALQTGNYQHQARGGAIDEKNLLQSGVVTAQELIGFLSRCNSYHCRSSPHHQIPEIEVHVIRKDAWYVKFYFIDPDTFFISVHQ